jgi:hypothetical protein
MTALPERKTRLKADGGHQPNQVLRRFGFVALPKCQAHQISILDGKAQLISEFLVTQVSCGAVTLPPRCASNGAKARQPLAPPNPRRDHHRANPDRNRRRDRERHPHLHPQKIGQGEPDSIAGCRGSTPPMCVQRCVLEPISGCEFERPTGTRTDPTLEAWCALIPQFRVIECLVSESHLDSKSGRSLFWFQLACVAHRRRLPVAGIQGPRDRKHSFSSDPPCRESLGGPPFAGRNANQ